MEQRGPSEGVSFFTRLGMAFRLIFSAEYARPLAGPKPEQELAAPVQPQLPPERLHASGLLLLQMLQREGRLVDFLQQDVASFSDEEVGAAARVVHTGCRKLLHQHFELEPALKEAEGNTVTIPVGFDAQRVRLTGNVAGQPPFRGTLKHHGWVAKVIRLPQVAEAMDPRVVAPAEVELP